MQREMRDRAGAARETRGALKSDGYIILREIADVLDDE
jgi:hypothetical protein